MAIKVLTIDDDPGKTAFLIKLFLFKGDTFDVQAANTGPAGLDIVRNWKPDVIVLDLMMPNIGGWEVCKEIRTFSQVPILILSVVSKSDQLTAAIDNGANDYISKPITKGELISHIIKLANDISIDFPSNTD